MESQNKHHELVQKLIDDGVIHPLKGERANYLVREWLEGAIQEWNRENTYLGQALGLTPKESQGRPVGPQAKSGLTGHEKWMGYKEIHASAPPAPVEGKEWPCEHIKTLGTHKYVFAKGSIHQCDVDQEFNFCPICAAPRPAKESLEEKFDKYIKQQATPDWHGTQRSVSVEELAEIARKHYEKEVA